MSVDNIKVALIQMSAGKDKERNLDCAERLVRQAAKKDAQLILLPECFSFRGDQELRELRRNVAETLTGPTVKRFQRVAQETRAFIVLGSVYEKNSNITKLHNTSVFIEKTGRVVGCYRKRNLFAASIQQKNVCERKIFSPGKRGGRFSVKGFSFGATICYDLRFPNIFQAYRKKGCDAIIVPSNFTYETGKAHWETLLRARAIENQSYILAPNQYGKSPRGIRSYGNSMIVDPWGKVLAKAKTTKEEIICATLHKRVIFSIRERLGRMDYGRAKSLKEKN